MRQEGEGREDEGGREGGEVGWEMTTWSKLSYCRPAPPTPFPNPPNSPTYLHLYPTQLPVADPCLAGGMCVCACVCVYGVCVCVCLCMARAGRRVYVGGRGEAYASRV